MDGESPSPLGQSRLDRPDRGSLHGLGGVGVGVEGGPDGRVPQHLGRDLGMDTRAEHHGGSGMSQIVEPYGRQPGLNQQGMERAAQHVPWIQGLGQGETPGRHELRDVLCGTEALAADAERGVVVDVLLNPLGYGAKGAASWLSNRRVHVRWAPDSPYLHAKVILSATEGLGGSANLSYHGLSINREMDAMAPASLLPAAWAWGTALWAKGTPAG